MLASVYAPKDFKRLRAAGDVVARCFDFISPHIKAGISTGEIDRMVAQFLKENGAKSSDLGYQGYPKHICTSVNDVIVHGIPSDAVILKDGDIVNESPMLIAAILSVYAMLFSDCADNMLCATFASANAITDAVSAIKNGFSRFLIQTIL